jgi:chromate transport protein ChrA
MSYKTNEFVLPSFLLIILMTGIIAEMQGSPSATQIVSFGLVASAWFVRQQIKN